MYKYSLLLAFIILQGCSNHDGEFFCESYHPMRLSKDISYVQQVVKVTPNEVCTIWRGDILSCAKRGVVTIGAWNNESGAATKERDSFRAQFDGEIVRLLISELTEPVSPSDVTMSKRSDGIYFAYKGFEFNIPLPYKDNSEDNRKTWALYAITNVEYWKGMRFGDDTSFLVGGDTYKSWHSRANDEPSYEYVFNTQKLTLTAKSLTDDFDSPHVFSCQIWNKQRWWQF